uniref:Uncharacterized protein n=1 Tax=Rhizophora mucronata TaxID=61149 RepID=A0A2P2PE51_RHIMU
MFCHFSEYFSSQFFFIFSGPVFQNHSSVTVSLQQLVIPNLLSVACYLLSNSATASPLFL